MGGTSVSASLEWDHMSTRRPADPHQGSCLGRPGHRGDEGGVAPDWVLDRVRRFNRRAFNPVVLALTAGGRRWAHFAIVRHVGRRSGRAYATPVWAVRTSWGFLVPLTYGTRADWCRNVMTAGSATVEHRGSAVAVDRPEVIDATLVVPRLPLAQRALLRLVGMRQFLLLRRAAARPC